MTGPSMHHVTGCDRETPLPAITYSTPRPMPKGLDWDATTIDHDARCKHD